MIRGQINAMRIKVSEDCVVWEMQGQTSKARLRRAMLKEIIIS